jgi:hypothetical protein
LEFVDEKGERELELEWSLIIQSQESLFHYVSFRPLWTLLYTKEKSPPPAPSIAASLILPAQLMIYMENPAKNLSLGRKK